MPFRIVPSVALLMASLAACSSNEAPGRPHDPGFLDAMTASGGARGFDATTGSGGAHSGGEGATLDSVDANSSSTFGVGGDGRCLNGASAFDADAGAPPPDCMAPCVWDLVKNCLPRGVCGAENDWQIARDPLAQLSGHSEYEVHTNGRLCSRFDLGTVPFNFSFPMWGYTDESGRTVATGYGGQGTSLVGNVVCADKCRYGPGPRECDGGAPRGVVDASICPRSPDECAAMAGLGYDVDPKQAKCTPWRGY